MNILFYGSAPTLGDAGIGFAILQDLRAMWPQARLLILTSTLEVYRALPACHGARFEPKPRSAPPPKAAWPGGADDHLRYLHRFLDIRFGGGTFSRDADLQRALRAYYGWADLVVHQGDPGWNDLWLNLGVLRMRLLRYAAARHFGTPVALLGQSFGPFDREGIRGRAHNRLVGFVLNQVQLITARDLFSMDHLCRLGVRRPRLLLATDAAVRLRSASAQRGREILGRFGVTVGAGRRRPLVGLSVRAIRQRYDYPDGEEQRFRGEMSRFLDQVVEEIGDIVFLSTDHADHENDLEVMRGLQQEMERGHRVQVVDEPFMPQEIMAAYGLLDLFIGVRLHPVIFALTQHAPALSIGHAPKCEDFMEQTGLAAWHVPYQAFTVKIGLAKLRALRDGRAPLREHIRVRMDVFQERAAQSMREAALLVEASKRPQDLGPRLALPSHP